MLIGDNMTVRVLAAVSFIYFMGENLNICKSSNTTHSPKDFNLERISVEDGIHVEKVGHVLIASKISTTTMISVIIRMPNILSDFYKSKYYYVTDKCKGRPDNDFNISIYWNAYFARTIKLNEENNKFIEERRSLLANYINIHSNKRQVLAFLGGALLGGGLSFGLSEIRLAQVREHVNANYDDIMALKHNIVNLRDQIATMGSKTIALIKNVRADLVYETRSLDCKIILQEMINTLQHAMARNHDEFDNILWTAISGDNNMLLNPRALDPISLKHIVHNTSLFEDLKYYDDPNLLYSTATWSLIDISQDLTTAHFVLSFPTIKRDSVPLKLYKVNQVGMFHPPRQCTYRNLPEYIIHDSETFKSINPKECVSHNNIHLCNPAAVEESPACIQEYSCDCEFTFTECSETLNNRKYFSSLAGILIRNNVPSTTFIRFYNTTIENVKLTKHFTTFISWTDIAEVHINSIKTISPNLVGKPIIKVNYLGNFTIPFGYYTNHSLISEFNSLTREFNNSIQNLLHPVIKDWKYRDPLRSKFTDYITLILSIINSIWLILISILALRLYLPSCTGTNCPKIYNLIERIRNKGSVPNVNYQSCNQDQVNIVKSESI